MAQKVTAALSDNLNLGHAYTIRFCALDPATGASVSGVNISLAQIHADAVTESGGTGGLGTGPVEAPIWVPIPSTSQ